MVQKRFMQVDAETGELIEEGFVAYVAPRRQNGFGKRWFAMAHDAASVLKQVKRVEDFRVLMALLEQLDYENLITTNQAEIARDLEMDRAQVNRAIKRLIEAGAVFEGPKVGISKTYRLNPEFGWRGSGRNHIAALDVERKKRMANAGIKGVIEGGQQAPQEAPERDPNTLDMFAE